MSMRRSSPVMVGRDEELEALEAAVADRRARPVILVGGEAGVGKSRLVAELVARTRALGAPATLGSCVHLGGDSLPYAPFIDGLGRFVDGLGERADGMLGATPEVLATLLPDPLTGDPVDRGVSRGQLYEAVRGLLDRAPDGLVFVLEDIHWADRSSLELLAYLGSRLRGGRTALVATFRSDELHRRHPLVPVLADLTRSGRSVRVDLERLDHDRVGTLVRAIRDDVPDALVRAIARRSEGNPFLVEELLAVDAGPAAPLPETVRDLLLARLTVLGDAEHRVLGIVATVGRPADVELVDAAWDGPAAELDPAIRACVDGALLVVQSPDGRLAFRHALIGEAVADDLLPGERVRLHAALARILTARVDLASPTRAGAAAEVAHHLFEAHDLPGAFAASVRAGGAAMAARAYPEARALYERCLGLVERIPDQGASCAVDRIDLIDAAAEASYHSGDATRAVALGRQAVALVGEAGEDARTAYLIGRLLAWSAATGEIGELADLAERAVALVPAEPPTGERALALLSLASARMHGGHYRACLELATEATDVAVATGSIGSQASARAMVAVALVGLGRDEEAIAAIDHAVRLADGSRGTAEVGIAHIDRAGVYSAAGRFADLPDVLAAARTAVDNEGLHEMSEAWLATDEVDLLVWQGCWSEAEALATRMIERIPAPSPLAWHLVVRGQLRVRTGRLEDGDRDLRAAVAVRPQVEPTIRAMALAGRAEAALSGDPRDAVRLVEDALAVLASTDDVPGRAHLFALGLRATAELAEWARARREPAASDVAADAARSYAAGLRAASAGELVDDGAAEQRVVARVAWGLAEEGRRTGRSEAAAWAAAADALAAAGEPYLAARCRYHEAEAGIGNQGGRARATSILREVRAWTARVGAEPLLRDVESLVRRARLDLSETAESGFPDGRPRTATSDPFGLSAREREVLELLVDGRTNREIGGSLFITEKTASSHVTHILDKLGVTSRGAAAALAIRSGVIGSDADLRTGSTGPRP